MNYVAEASDDPPSSGKQCDINNEYAGTVLYHNCDAPNILTDIVQGVVGTIIPSGPANAEVSSALVPYGLGLPSSIPGSGNVPIDRNGSPYKFTALELYGYNLKYTSYQGEWDHIEVSNSARMLANFGVLDKIKLGGKVIIDGIYGGVKAGASAFVSNLKDGDVIGAISEGLGGLFGGGSSAAVNTFIDTSDNNVFNSWGWYRVGYSSTMYNARELSNEERSVYIQNSLQTLLAGSPEDAEVPEELRNISAGPPRPTGAISKCEGKNSEGEYVVIESEDPAGFNKENCIAQVEAKNYTDAKYSAEGGQKKELLKDWVATNQATLDIAKKYNIICEMNTDESTRDANITAFYDCFKAQYGPAATAAVLEEQGTIDQSFWDKLTGPEFLMAKYMADPSINMNAPWSRYVCTDSNGKDLEGNESPLFPGYVFLYNSDKELNPACGPIRPPIQNGLFGNGYQLQETSGRDAEPAIDTRWDALPAVTPLMFMKPSMIGNAGLSVTTIITQLSNTVLDLSFSPILDRLGFRDIIVELIGGFRDSIYYPFATLLVAISAVGVLLSAGRDRDYNKAFRHLLMIVLSFMLAVMLLYKPETIVRGVDEVPSQIEMAIMGSIFQAGLDPDEAVCSATGDSRGTVPSLTGSTLNFSPTAALRTMECEVWRAFAFTPWVEGQFGTSYSNLYANGKGPSGRTFTNGNKNLVGDAEVEMGRGVKVNNWAMYQLHILSSGTSTTPDPTNPTGVVPRNFYRLVDLQAGPSTGKWSTATGEGHDGRYFKDWSGQSSGYRSMVGMFAPVVAFIGFITILIYAFFKIEITIVTALILLVMPFMLLAGIQPTWGLMRLKKWGGLLLGLILQRIMLVTLLAIYIKILAGVSAGANGQYLISGLLMIVVSLVFIFYRKPIMELMTKTAGSATGGVMGEQLLSDPIGAAKSAAPRSVRNTASMVSMTGVGVAGGAIGGYLSGGMSGARKGVKEATQDTRSRAKNKIRRNGMSGFSKARDAATAGSQAASRGIDEKRKLLEAKQKEVSKNAQAEVNKLNTPLFVDPKTGELVKDRNAAIAPENINIDFSRPRNSMLLSQLTDIERDIEGLKAERARLNTSDFDYANATAEEKLDHQRMIAERKGEIDEKVKKLEFDKGAVLNDLHKTNDPEGAAKRAQLLEEQDRVKSEKDPDYQPPVRSNEAPPTNRREKRSQDILEMKEALYDMREQVSQARDIIRPGKDARKVDGEDSE
jgi:hypothetical protein